MEIKLLEIYKKEMSKIIENAKNFRYYKCAEISNHLTYTYLVLESKEGVFFCEFLSYLFLNVQTREDEKAKDISKKLIRFLTKIKEMNIFEGKDGLKIYKELMEIRYNVTDFQSQSNSTNVRYYNAI